MKPSRQANPQTVTRHNVSLSQSQTTITVSPIPSADEMQKYEQVYPGFAERLMRTYEKEQEERLQQTREMVKMQAARERRNDRNILIGLIFGLVTVVLLCGLCGYFAYMGNIEWAAKTAIGCIAAVVSVFVLRRALPSKASKDNEFE